MIQNIQYKGFSSNPSDYESVDGELAMSMNLINEDEQLKPVCQPKNILSLSSAGDRVLCIHKTSQYTHYICVNSYSNQLYWRSSNSGGTIGSLTSLTGITKAVSIGNTLCVLHQNGMDYFLWFNDNGGYYKPLGNKLPEIGMSFGLQCKIEKTDSFNAIFEATLVATSESGVYVPKPTEDGITALTNQVLAKTNKLLSDITDKGRFSQPFFVRYALRLFDGSLAAHSAPILMMPSCGTSPIVVSAVANGGSSTAANVQIEMQAFAPSCALDAACTLSSSDIQSLAQWGDIIQSVDIFVSAPIYKYDQSGKCESFVLLREDDTFGYYSMADLPTTVYPEGGSLRTNLSKYSQWKTLNAIRAQHGNADFSTDIYGLAKVSLPEKDSFMSDIASCSTFYFVKSIPLSDIANRRSVVDISGGYLKALQTMEVMTDDYDSHDQLMPSNAFVYNSRLILSGIKKKLFTGYLSLNYIETTLSNFTFAGTGYVSNVSDYYSYCYRILYIYTYLRKNNRTYIVRQDLPNGGLLLSSYSDQLFIPYAYHPDSGAYKMEAYCMANNGGASRMISIDLKPHDFLNGSFYFDSLSSQTMVSPSYPITSSDITFPCSNKLYVSEIDNPFFFPVTGIISVGAGSVIGLSAAAKALSQGQFGQFPLYVFTTDGVWALSVSSTGSFSAVQPITRDVCINADSITSIDDTVLFATDRGVISLSGSEHRCVSDPIFGEDPFDLTTLPHISTLHSLLGHGSDACIPTQPFLTFLQKCQMVYDYVHQRVIVFNPSVSNGTPSFTYAYVLSIKSGRWGMMYSNILANTNSYPDALVTLRDGRVASFSDTDQTEFKGMFVTRPIALGDGSAVKSIRHIIQKGYLEKADVCTVLYGSNDLFHWFIIGSSTTADIRNLRGTPYRYFRIAGVSTLSGSKSLFGASCFFEPRHLNVAR